uniref:Anaphase-promoting complex subunit 1 n=1 Tax=Rhabditophanes sp. KR3021 TaxID=114890 RepID=A0AC35UII9_9BILA
MYYNEENAFATQTINGVKRKFNDLTQSDTFDRLYKKSKTEYVYHDSLRNITSIDMRVIQYINNRLNECIVSFKTPLSIPKSYYGEKRRLNPNPIITLENKEGWSHFQKLSKNMNNQFQMRNSDNIRKLTVQNLRPSKIVGMAHTLDTVDKEVLDFNDQKMHTLKNIFFPSNKNSKSTAFNLSCNLFTSNGYSLGTFKSAPINVISKARRKKMNCKKNSDIYNSSIRSNSTITLSSKSVSSNLRSRCIATDEEGFICSVTEWDVLKIYLIDEDENDRETFQYKEDYIKYGSIVKIVSTKNGMALPMLRILYESEINNQKCVSTFEKDMVGLVSEMQKVCFQFVENPQLFLCFKDEKIVTSKGNTIDGLKYMLEEDCFFQISSADETIVKFSFLNGKLPQTPIFPYPSITKFIQTGGDATYKIQIEGRNFSTCLSIWIGARKMNQIFVLSSESFLILLNREQYRWLITDNDDDKTFYFVREDGVIYSTERSIFD